MRPIPSLTLIQRLNYVSRGKNLFKISNIGGVLSQSSRLELSSPVQSKRYSSHDSHGPSAFTRTSLVYSVLGAAFIGGILGFLTISDSKDTKKVAKQSRAPVSVPKPEPVDEVEEPAAEETVEETVVEAVAASSELETQPESTTESTPVSTEPEVVPVPESESPAKVEQEKFLPEIPNHAQYLIVGGGTTAMSAFKSIRANDPDARVLVVTEENYKPYMRPPLSKDLWTTDDEQLVKELRFKQYNGNERSLFFLEDEFYIEPKYLNEEEHGGVAVVTGKRVTQVDIQNKTVKLDNNWEISYDKCLIATGGKPRNLPIFEKSENLKEKVTLFRNIDDFKNLHSIAKQGKTIAIVGGGFLGSELACALSHATKKYGGKVIQIFPEQGNLGKVLPEYLSQWTTKRVTDEGVTVIPQSTVTKAQINDQKVELSVKDNTGSQWLLVDHVVVAVGLEPNVQLASKSGFEIDPKLGGYVVNAELQARNSIWVAGDAACFYDIKLGRRRVEHHDHAVVSGRLAGENMSGKASKPYWHQSMFWSDIGPNIGFEAIGLVDSSLQTVGLFAKADKSDTPQAQVSETNETLRSEVDASKVSESNKFADAREPSSKDEYGKGVVLYLKDDVIVGVLLWNVFRKIPIARQLIQSQEKVTDLKELAKLFQINPADVDEASN